MKLIRFGEKGKEKPGIERDGERYDCSSHFQDWDAKFFRDGELKKLKDLIDGDVKLPLVLPDERWGSPIARPGMIMCVGLNYADHAAESGLEVPAEPVLFMKATNTIAGPYDAVNIPLHSEKTDWEVELGVILSKDVYGLKNEKEAEEAIAGFCVVNDLSEREFQLEKGGQWVKGKSCPGFSPVGPYLVTKDEVEDVNNLRMTLTVNGEVMQDGNTKTMVFDPYYVVWYISQYMMLEAGDLISTGTPPGVGLGMNPPKYLGKGDQVVLQIDGLGEQSQGFV